MEAREIKINKNKTDVGLSVQVVYKMSPFFYGYEFIVLSKAYIEFLNQWETHIFPCKEDGEFLEWTELTGSLKGDYSNIDVLKGINYKIVKK